MFFSIRCFAEEKLSSSVPPNSKHFFVATFWNVHLFGMEPFANIKALI
jgi:hypothetical protein